MLVKWGTKFKNLAKTISDGIRIVQNSNEFNISKEFLLTGFKSTVDLVRNEFLPQKRIFELSEQRQIEVSAIQREIRAKRLQLNQTVPTQSVGDDALQAATAKDMVSGPPQPVRQDIATTDASHMQGRQIRVKDTSHRLGSDEDANENTELEIDQRTGDSTTTADVAGSVTG